MNKTVVNMYATYIVHIESKENPGGAMHIILKKSVITLLFCTQSKSYSTPYML